MSSSAVPFYKTFLPVLWLAFWGLGASFLDAATAHYEMFLGVAVLGAWFLFWYGSRLRKVILDGETLIISNYSREVSVPLTSVSQVKGSRLAKTKDVIITFDHDIGFGDRVVFLPKTRLLWPWQGHPVAAEMRELTGCSRD